MIKSDRTIQEAVRHHQAGRFKEAEALYREVLAHSPRHPRAAGLLGTLCNQTYRPAEGLELLRIAVAAEPRSPENWANLGNSLKGVRRHEEAVEAYQAAIRLNPKFAGAYNGLGNALQLLGRYEDAEQAFRTAIDLAPGYAEAHNNLGSDLIRLCRHDEAVVHLRRALQLNPSLYGTISNLFLAPTYGSSVTAEDYSAFWRECDRLFMKMFAEKAVPHRNDRTPERPLRIGYVSRDFIDHSVNYFFEPILAAHDRSQFIVHCYSDVEEPDATTARLISYGDIWREVRSLDDDALAQQVREDEIDILVDLAGHTEKNRMPVFARKAAPVQVTMIGFPDTTGLSAIDYRITDAVADPPGKADRLNAERLIRMPDVAWVYRPPERLPEPTPRLPDEPVTFASITTMARVNERVLATWSRVLKAAPQSRLVMQAGEFKSVSTRDRVATQWAANGIAEERIELRPPASLSPYLRMIANADLVLDTFPFNGGTTSYHALAVGTPLLTLRGDRHAGRIGASLLTCLGMTELIADDVDEYIEIAARLANAPDQLRAMRSGLRERVLGSAICDGPRYTGHLENAYRQMWRTWCASEPVTSPSAR